MKINLNSGEISGSIESFFGRRPTNKFSNLFYIETNVYEDEYGYYALMNFYIADKKTRQVRIDYNILVLKEYS